ncbi:MAG TPA: ATP-binding protein [Opitutaceae bacterium]|nr:ATP-binding protein [Opitutaceae bacterium]
MSPVFFAAVAVLVVGIVILWSNPDRAVNRAVCTCSIHIASWLTCLYFARASIRGSSEGLFWYRSGCAVGAWIPLHFWIVKEIITAGTSLKQNNKLIHLGIWIIVSIYLSYICFTEYFIPSSSTHDNRVRGWGYSSYIAICIGLYSFLIFDALRTIRHLVGARRLELQVWLLGGCSIAATVLALMALNGWTHDVRYISFQPLVILIFFTATSIAITTHRIFDARQIFLVGLQKIFLVISIAGIAFGLDKTSGLFMPEPISLVLTTAVALWAAAIINSWLDRVFHFYPQATAARQAAFSAAQRENRVDRLEGAFGQVLRGWGQSDRAIVLSGNKEAIVGGGLELTGQSAVFRGLQQLRWATPERLTRERLTPERAAVQEFLEKHRLGVAAIIEGPSLTTIVGVGVGASRRPFTYPQITQLLELASIMENALERAHFSAKAQHAEQLATVGLLGASLAHEIRNPLVTIKSFVQLLPTRHQEPAFREKFFRLIGDEVTRIDQLTEQLLEMASPRSYVAQMLELHPVLRASLELVAAKAAHKDVQFLTDFQASPDRVFTDASAAKQVMLNLCFNAIQAVEAANCRERWVKIATRNTGVGIEMAVADSGPGISPEIRSRLFQPFQTTKSSGFGLGLAICSDILANLNASITVDPPVPGQGATFRVIFPCQPSSS